MMRARTLYPRRSPDDPRAIEILAIGEDGNVVTRALGHAEAAWFAAELVKLLAQDVAAKEGKA